MDAPFPRRWPLYLLWGGSLAVAILAISSAVSFHGHPIAEVLVDPGGVVSNFGPSAGAAQAPLRFPDRIVAVEGQPLSGAGAPRARAWDEAVARAYRRGATAISVRAESDGVPRTVRLAVAPLESVDWWIYGGALLFASALYAAAGAVALSANPKSRLARTFGTFAAFTALFVGLLFDFHTTRALVPLFFVGFAMVPPGLVALALRLPDDARVLERHPWLEGALGALGSFVAVSFVWLHESGRETRALQAGWTAALGASLCFFAITFAVRYVAARGVRRSRLRALLAAVVPPQLVIGAIAFPAARTQGMAPLVEALSYASLSLFPIATAYAFIRHDLWGSRALLSRILMRLAASALGVALAVALAAVVATGLGVSFRDALVAASLGGAASVSVVLVALRLLDRHVFSARVRYRPTVERLGDELSVLTSPEEVARAVERAVRQWLPCERITLRLTPPPTPLTGPSLRPGSRGTSRPPEGDGPHLPSGSAGPDGSGVRLLATTSPPPAVAPDGLTIPFEFAGVPLATLHLGAKEGGALFNEDDLALLRTIANQGALALAHAFAYQELEARRKEQAEAFRGERAALVETVAAEIAHEVRYPINFFRSVFERRGAQRTLDDEELDIGLEEVARLERLVAGLRRMTTGRAVERRWVPLTELCDRAETLLRDTLGDRTLERNVPPLVELACDPDQALQVLTNLVTNGLEAAGPEGTVGIELVGQQGSEDSAESGVRAAGARLTVWDTGPGFDDDARPFAPWYTTKRHGTGLGLAITHRLVRAHGWSITAARGKGRTELTVTLRTEDVVTTEAAPVLKMPSSEVA